MDGISGIITVFSIVAAFYGALLTVFMLILSALWLRMGNVQQELGGVRASVRLLQEEMHRSQDEFREEMRRSQDEFREEMRRSQDELREDFQRGHNQLMRAILAHSHRDDGRPTFDLPPDFEPTPADN